MVCSPSFNRKLSSNATLVRLWCDPSDPACDRGSATRAPKKVKILVSDCTVLSCVKTLAFRSPCSHRCLSLSQANFEKTLPPCPTGSQVRWADDNTKPPTSNLTIVHPDASSPDFDSYAKFSGTVYANTGYSKIATITPSFAKIDLSEYVQRDSVMDQGSIVVEARCVRRHPIHPDHTQLPVEISVYT